MATVRVELPSLLRPIVGGQRSLTVDADSVETAFTAIRERYPALRVHLFDEAGDLREHVLCFHNEANTRWTDASSARLREGDTLLFLQAVSGG